MRTLGLNALIREALAASISRGRVEFTVRLKDASEGTSIEVNHVLAQQCPRGHQTGDVRDGPPLGIADLIHDDPFDDATDACCPPRDVVEHGR